MADNSNMDYTLSLGALPFDDVDWMLVKSAEEVLGWIAKFTSMEFKISVQFKIF